MTAAINLDIVARDVSRQRSFRASAVSGLSTIGELTKTLVSGMGLLPQDSRGNPLSYRLRLEREGRQLSSSEFAADALKTGDEVVITPRIAAG